MFLLQASPQIAERVHNKIVAGLPIAALRLQPAVIDALKTLDFDTIDLAVNLGQKDARSFSVVIDIKHYRPPNSRVLR